MTEMRRMQLHLGKCIDDLDKMHNVPDLKSKRTIVLCKSALKLFEKAEEYREKGDEEYAYVYYMRYLRVIAYLSKDKDYQKDKQYFNSMLGTKNPSKAIDAAEKLKKSLIDRYTLAQPARPDTKPEQPPAPRSESPAPPPPSITPTAPPLPGLDEVTIRSEQLYPVLKGGQSRVMLLDCRPGTDFNTSHINHPACISVPEEVISPGQSANVLEQNLPAESRAVWAQRATMDLIVMMDWSSNTVIPGKTLFLLKTILLKWDVKVHYARPPLALAGGYEDWLLKYPALTTNPRAHVPTKTRIIDHLLDEIEYPSWADVSPPPEVTAPPAAPAANPPRPPKPDGPVVDRSSKAAAIQMMTERARNMQLLLEQQERIADTSLTLEMQRIEAEQDWERVRGQRENENRDEVRDAYKLREHEIISQLMQLENKQYDMEQENQQLRAQLEEYQRREREEHARLAASLPHSTDASLAAAAAAQARELSAKRARIAATNRRREELDRRREQLEAERKRRLHVARESKKPNLHKDEDGDAYMSSPRDSPPYGALNRSHSSPNLANGSPSADEEESGAPVFDRSTKPAARAPSDLRVRDLEPYWGQVGRGLTGLRNIGNSCYLNSIVQCLNNTTMLVPYFCNGQYLDHINRSSSTGGVVAEEFAAVVRALWSGQYKYIAPKNLRAEVGRYQRSFRSGDQQDSHELLTILVDWLHHDLRISVPPPPQESWSPSDKAWFEFTRGKESLISRLFYGQIRSSVRCSVCGNTSVTYDSFSNLSLELPDCPHRCSLEDCLRLYLSGETIQGWNCPQCKEKRSATKKLDISRLPPVLVIHFKRFYVDKEGFQKRQTLIEFPLAELDMRPFSLSKPTSLYDLYAVSNHYGTMQSGHYTAFCKNSLTGKWYHFDDHVSSELPVREVRTSAAYILFYSTCRAVC